MFVGRLVCHLFCPALAGIAFPPAGGGALCTDPGPESWHAYAAGCSAHLLRGFFQVFPPRVLWHKTADRACCLVRHVPSGSNVCWAWSWWADLSAACAFGQLRLLGLELEGRLGLQHVPLRSSRSRSRYILSSRHRPWLRPEGVLAHKTAYENHE